MDCLQDVLVNDERKGKYRWMWEYNSEVNVKIQKQIDLSVYTKYGHRFFVLVMTAATVATTIAFLPLIYSDPATFDTEAVAQSAAQFLDPWSVLLSVILEVYYTIYSHLTVRFMEAYNYRFKKDFNDGLAWYLFFYNCFNFFFPLATIALWKQSFLSVFTIMFVLLVLEQGKTAYGRWHRPYCGYRAKAAKVKAQWKALKSVEFPT
jgi:hypothetical protein